jgi:hypothetical protein
MKRTLVAVGLLLLTGVLSPWCHASTYSLTTPVPQTTATTEDSMLDVAGPLSEDADFDGTNELITADNTVFFYRLNGALWQDIALGGSPFISMDQKDFHEIASSGDVLALLAGSTTFASLPGWPASEIADSAMSIADFNQDGINDYAYVEYDTAYIRGRHGGLLPGWPVDLEASAQLSFDGLASTVEDATPFVVGDLDRDGAPDLILTGSVEKTVCLNLNTDAPVSCDYEDAYEVDLTLPSLRALRANGQLLDSWTASGEGERFIGAPVMFASSSSIRKVLVAYAEDCTRDDPTSSDPEDVIDYVKAGVHDFTSSLTNSGKARFSNDDSEPQFGAVVGNVDQDAYPDVLLVDDGVGALADADVVLSEPPARVHLFRGSGFTSEAEGWPVPLAEAPSGPPIIGDIDGNGDQEVLIGTAEGIAAFHHDGEPYRVMQGTVDTFVGVVRSETTNDYKRDLFPKSPVAGTTNVAVYFKRLELAENVDYVYIYPGNVTLPPIELFDVWQTTHPPLMKLTGTYFGWTPSFPGSQVHVVLRTNASRDYYGYIIDKVMRNAVRNEPFAAYAPGDVLGSPWLGDADQDGILDLLYNDGSTLRLLRLNIPYRPEFLEWPMYRHDAQRSNTYLKPQPRPANTAPQLQPITNRTVKEGNVLALTLRASDAERQPLSYNVVFPATRPPGSQYDAGMKIFRLAPAVGSLPATETGRNYAPVRFTVSDGSATDYEDVVFRIERSQPPSFTPGTLNDRTVAEGASLAFTVTATDPNSQDEMFFSATGLPTGATFSPTGAFSWRPEFNQSRSYVVSVTVSDGQLTATGALRITVSDVPVTLSGVSDTPDPLGLKQNGSLVVDATIQAGLNHAANWTVALAASSAPATVLRRLQGSGSSIQAIWNGKNDAGAALPAGTYTYQITATDSGNSQASANGFITIATLATLFSETFESGATGWAAKGLWHASTVRAGSPVTSYVYNDGADYDTGVANSGTLTSPSINLAQVTSATLSFRSFHRTESSAWFDVRTVEVSSNGGTTWTVLKTLSNDGQGVWSTVGVDLASQLGQTIRVRFQFNTQDAIDNAYEGWYIDDVQVVGSTPSKDDTPPTLSFISPTPEADAELGAPMTVKLAVEAQDASGIARVEFCDGTAPCITDTTAPYSYAWPITSTTALDAHSWRIIARDNSVNQNQSVVQRTFYVLDMQKPVVAFTSPAAGLLIIPPQQVLLAATASDNDAVSYVEFYGTGEQLIPNDTTSPYSYLWNVTNATRPGQRVLFATARDRSGNMQSVQRNVTVTRLTNGHFENGEADWGFPLFPVPSVQRITLPAPRGGVAKLTLSSQICSLVHSRTPVQAGQSYQLTVTQKAEGVTRYGMIRVHWLNAAGSNAGLAPSDTPIFYGTSDWTTVTTVIKAPTGATSAQVDLRAYPGTGAVYFDDVTLY